MNVGELRAALAQYPDEMDVMYDDPDSHGPFEIAEVHTKVYPTWPGDIRALMAHYGVYPEMTVMLS